MNKCIACNTNSPKYTKGPGSLICAECYGINTIINVDQAYDILFNAISEGLVFLSNPETDPENGGVYYSYVVAEDPFNQDISGLGVE